MYFASFNHFVFNGFESSYISAGAIEWNSLPIRIKNQDQGSRNFNGQSRSRWRHETILASSNPPPHAPWLLELSILASGNLSWKAGMTRNPFFLPKSKQSNGRCEVAIFFIPEILFELEIETISLSINNLSHVLASGRSLACQKKFFGGREKFI